MILTHYTATIYSNQSPTSHNRSPTSVLSITSELEAAQKGQKRPRRDRVSFLRGFAFDKQRKTWQNLRKNCLSSHLPDFRGDHRSPGGLHERPQRPKGHPEAPGTGFCPSKHRSSCLPRGHVTHPAPSRASSASPATSRASSASPTNS